MKAYICTICDKLSYSAADIIHTTEPKCPYCGGEIWPAEEIIKEKPKMIKTSNKTVNISNIIVPQAFRSALPKTEKIANCYENYRRLKLLDREIVVDDTYVLRDGYIAYLIAKMVGMEKVKVLQIKEVAEKAKPTEINKEKPIEPVFEVGKRYQIHDSHDWNGDVLEVTSIYGKRVKYKIIKTAGACHFTDSFDIGSVFSQKLEPYSEPAEPEQPKEPIKLYCTKDYEPGVWITEGKIYELDESGLIHFDDGYSRIFADMPKLCNITSPLFSLVKRPAKVGERIIPLYATGCHTPPVDKSKLQIVIETLGERYIYPVQTNFLNSFSDDEYLVLDGYKPEPEKLEYLNMRVVCVESKDEDFTVGKIYEFKNGSVVDNDGDKRPNFGAKQITSLNDLYMKKWIYKFVEFKGTQE